MELIISHKNSYVIMFQWKINICRVEYLFCILSININSMAFLECLSKKLLDI